MLCWLPLRGEAEQGKAGRCDANKKNAKVESKAAEESCNAKKIRHRTSAATRQSAGVQCMSPWEELEEDVIDLSRQGWG